MDSWLMYSSGGRIPSLISFRSLPAICSGDQPSPMATDRGTYWIYILVPAQYPIVMWLQMRRDDLPRVNTLVDMIHISIPKLLRFSKSVLPYFHLVVLY